MSRSRASRESAPLRVLLVCARYFPAIGGLETHVYEVGRRLAQAGADIMVLTTDVSGGMPAAEWAEGVRIRRVRAWPAERDYYFAPDIYRKIRHGRWDVVHCQGYHTLVPPLAMLAARRAGLPYVVSFHSGGHSSRIRKVLRGAQWAALRPLLVSAERLVAVSRFEAEFFRRRLRLPTERFVVIPNGAQLPDPGGAPAAPAEGDLVVSIGRLERYKGHHRVIAALPVLLKQRPHLRLRIAGSGPYESALRRLARELGVADRVEIRPVPASDRRGMAALLSNASLVVLLSEYESHGIALLEAAALGRPVLVADTSGLSELAERGLARAIPLESSPAHVATAVLEQLRRPAPPATVDLPTWDQCASDLLALYAEIGRRPACVSSC